jgi:hypothetical protein
VTPEVGRQLADLGAFALLVLTWALLAVGYFRKWFVPGWLYDALREDWRILRDQGDRNAKALEALVNDGKRRGG